MKVNKDQPHIVSAMEDQKRTTPLKDALTRAGEKYRDLVALRAAVQAIPYIGGALDTLLSGHAGKIQEERFQSFLVDLDSRLRRLENVGEVEPDEEFLDFMVIVFDGVLRSKSKEKRARFARIVANQVQTKRDWEEADTAVRLLTELSDIHVAVLREALNAPVCGPPFEGLRVIALVEKPLSHEQRERPIVLTEVLPEYTHLALKMACAELTARALLHDEGIAHWDTGALDYLVPTDLASWFIDWLSDESKTEMQ